MCQNIRNAFYVVHSNSTTGILVFCASFGLLGMRIFVILLQIMPFPSVQIYSASVLSILVKDIQN